MNNNSIFADPIIAENIKKYRNERSLTQKQLGEKIHKSEISIRKYESGNSNIPTSTFIHIAKALDVDLLTLASDADGMIEEDILKKLKNEVPDERIIYSKQSVINEIDKKSKFYEYIENVLRSEFLQEEFNYKYEEFVMQEDFDEIVEFVFEMFKMKMDQIKLKKINKDSTTAPRPIKIRENIYREKYKTIKEGE